SASTTFFGLPRQFEVEPWWYLRVVFRYGILRRCLSMHLRKTLRLLGLGLLAAGVIAAVVAIAQTAIFAAHNTGVISGTVTSSQGPEAGVWVIAETDDLQTKFRKIVVTNDQGKYLLPDLPKPANYKLWVRGYGLRDSEPVKSAADRTVNLTALVA